MNVQVDAGSAATDGAKHAPAADAGGVVASKRFYSAEAAAKHWAAPMGIVVRPGGYLHTPTHDAYPDVPVFLRAPGGSLCWDVHRLYDHDYRCGVKGYTELATILFRHDLMYSQIGPRGATQYYLRSS